MRGKINREQWASQAEIDRVALGLIESVGIEEAWRQAMPAAPERPAVNYRDREFTHRVRRGPDQLTLRFR